MPIKIKPEKLLATDDLGQSPVKNNGPNKFCYNFKILLDDIFISCVRCNFVYFCGNKWKQSSVQHHQKLCKSTSQLQEQHRGKIINSDTYSTTLTINETRALAELVRERCTVNCISVLPTVKNSAVNVVFPIWTIVELPNLCFSNI